MSRMIFGCGYLGRRVASRWQSTGETVCAVTRNADHAAHFFEQGWQPFVADIMNPHSLVNLPPASTVLFSVGFDRTTNESIERVYVDGLKNVLAALDTRSVERFIYISSTGVYGQSGDVWVNEDSPCEPSRDGGKACLAAENILRRSPVGDRSVILRLAGIYGPGRVPRLTEMQKAGPMPVSNGFLNVIHVEDAADVVVLAASFSPPKGRQLPRTFLVADGNPVRRHDYYDELARCWAIPKPDYTDPISANQPIKARRLGSKRVRTDRMMRELKPSLNFPSYRQGLQSIIGEVDAETGES